MTNDTEANNSVWQAMLASFAKALKLRHSSTDISLTLFIRYPVSDFADQLLQKIQDEPLFNVNDINSSLYKNIRTLAATQVRLCDCICPNELFPTVISKASAISLGSTELYMA